MGGPLGQFFGTQKGAKMEPKWDKRGSKIDIKNGYEKRSFPRPPWDGLKAILARVGGRLGMKKVIISLVLKAFRENRLFR